MSESSGWKERIQTIQDSLFKKEVITILGITAFMGTAYWVFKKLPARKDVAARHLNQIQSNILRMIDEGIGSRQSLTVEQQEKIDKKGVSMIFTIISKLKDKQKNAAQSIRNPFLPPFEEGLFIQDLGKTHNLLFNKFNIYQQHLLVTTKQFQAQSIPLNRDDFKQTIYAFKANKGLYFFNSGPNAGASQKHKHIQIFPRQARNLPIFRSMLQFVRNIKTTCDQLKVIQYKPFTFAHGLVLFGTVGVQSQTDDLDKKDHSRVSSQLSLLEQQSLKAYQLLRHDLLSQYKEGTDYNLVGCQQFLLMIPRSRERAFNDISVNAVGFMGSVLFNSKQKMSQYVEQGRHGLQILEEITFPKEDRSRLNEQ